jgi:hypothetical protein
MDYRDEDIDYTKIKWQRFEELCFDILHKYQYYGLKWNKGGADGGRDIEACFGVANPITGFTRRNGILSVSIIHKRLS